MTFSDIFKSSFLEKTSSFSLLDAGLALGGAFLVGMLIFFIYKKTFTGMMYSRSFNISLVALTMLTTFIILAVTSNVILSLGMVGALSIVRFRTAIKDPMDLVFLFWSIASGIVLGAGLLPLAAAGNIVIALLLLVFAGQHAIETPYIVMVTCTDEAAEQLVQQTLTRHFSKTRIKSKTVSPEASELVYELRMKNGETRFVNELSALQGVHNVALVSYNGEYVA